MSPFCRGSLGLVDGQTSLIFSLPICIGSSSPRTAASGHSLQMFCSGEQWRGLKPSRRDYFHRARPGLSSTIPLSSGVLCMCTAPPLHIAEACAHSLINLKPQAETQGV